METSTRRWRPRWLATKPLSPRLPTWCASARDAQTERVTHAEDYRRRPGFHGWRHASARRADRGSDQGLQVRGWVMPYFDQEFGEEIDRVFKEKFDLLLGRKTYEIFAAYWPYYEEDAPHGGIAKQFNEIKKYAVSRSGKVDTSWQGSVLFHDIADVKRLKQGTVLTSSRRAVPNSCMHCSLTIWSTR